MALYTNAWNDYKARRNLALSAFTCGIILLVTVFFLPPNTTPFIAVVAVVAGMVALAIASIYLCFRWTAWPCPKCGKPFFGGKRLDFIVIVTLSAVITNCRHCGFAKTEIIANS
jgi:hypothetical protein